MTPLKLREYQQEDVVFLKQRNCMACFNEQRTGKTPTALRSLIERNITKFVVVCPASAMYPWSDAIKDWCNLPTTIVSGLPARKHKRISTWEQGALIISYGSLKSTNSYVGMLEDVLEKYPDAIIADEAHRFKSYNSATARAMFKTMNIPIRLALTGTPAPNKPEEVWSILHWLYPQIFKSYWAFISEFFNTSLKYGGQGRTFKDITSVKHTKEPELNRILSRISTQRKRKDVMQWLPDKDYTSVRLPLTSHQEKYLKELEKYYETEHVITRGALDRLTRYRQVCLAPELLALPGSSPKLAWLLDYVSDYPDTPTIVFSKFTSFITILERELKNKKSDYRVIVGDTPITERDKSVKAFQSGKTKLLILQIDTGKEALTLDTGEVVIFIDQYPPASDIAQAEDRFIATTPERAHKPHSIIRLMMADSYDERLYELVAQRASTTEIINDYKNYNNRKEECKR